MLNFNTQDDYNTYMCTAVTPSQYMRCVASKYAHLLDEFNDARQTIFNAIDQNDVSLIGVASYYSTTFRKYVPMATAVTAAINGDVSFTVDDDTINTDAFFRAIGDEYDNASQLVIGLESLAQDRVDPKDYFNEKISNLRQGGYTTLLRSVLNKVGISDKLEAFSALITANDNNITSSVTQAGITFNSDSYTSTSPLSIFFGSLTFDVHDVMSFAQWVVKANVFTLNCIRKVDSWIRTTRKKLLRKLGSWAYSTFIQQAAVQKIDGLDPLGTLPGFKGEVRLYSDYSDLSNKMDSQGNLRVWIPGGALIFYAYDPVAYDSDLDEYYRKYYYVVQPVIRELGLYAKVISGIQGSIGTLAAAVKDAQDGTPILTTSVGSSTYIIEDPTNGDYYDVDYTDMTVSRNINNALLSNGIGAAALAHAFIIGCGKSSINFTASTLPSGAVLQNTWVDNNGDAIDWDLTSPSTAARMYQGKLLVNDTIGDFAQGIVTILEKILYGTKDQFELAYEWITNVGDPMYQFNSDRSVLNKAIKAGLITAGIIAGTIVGVKAASLLIGAKKSLFIQQAQVDTQIFSDNPDYNQIWKKQKKINLLSSLTGSAQDSVISGFSATVNSSDVAKILRLITSNLS